MNINETVELKKYDSASLRNLEAELNELTETFVTSKQAYDAQIKRARRLAAKRAGDILVLRSIPGAPLALLDNYVSTTVTEHPGFDSPTKTISIVMGARKIPAYDCNDCGIVKGYPLRKSVDGGIDELCYVCGEITGYKRYKVR
ncbi:MAG: hypothetical protein ACP5N2_06580 [Candidatus Nanoarchaeia archaeon]